MANPDKFDKTLATLAEAWGQSTADERGKALGVLYQVHSARFIALNRQIWTTAATMIPLSLGSFALLASIRNPSLGHIIALSVVGSALATTWLVIAENHRAFQDSSAAWMRAIERCWGMSQDIAPKPPASWLVRPRMIRTARFVLWWLVTIGSVLTVVFWPGGLVSR